MRLELIDISNNKDFVFLESIFLDKRIRGWGNIFIIWGRHPSFDDLKNITNIIVETKAYRLF